MKHQKNILTFCTFLMSLLCFISLLHAQIHDSLSYAQHLRQKLSILDKTKAYTGYLYDQTPASITPTYYMGLDIDSMRPDAYGFRTLIRQHEAAKIKNPDNDSLYKRLDSINSYYQGQGIVAVNILHFAYDKIRYDAFDSGYIQYNNNIDSFFINGPDTSHSPFVGFNVFSSAPWYGSFSGLAAKFVFPSSLFISNINNPIIKIEFETEGTLWQTVNAGQVIQVNYEDSGMKWCSIRLTLQNGNSNPIVLQSGFHAYFGKTWDITQVDAHIDITAASLPALPFNQVCETTSDYDPYGKLRYYIKYANTDHVLRKPFIFVEGIDFDYKDYYPTQGNWRYGEFGWDVFTSGGQYPHGFPDFDTKGKPYTPGGGIQLLIKESNGGNNGLINQLLSQGYDVILVDFARGADYIQKNAYALVKAIQDINNRKSGTEENVIVGASMGGLVVRYALAYMEKNNLPHCTRLYVSFDSPHLGANIPIGLQFGLLFSAGTGNDVAIEQVRRLNLPAAKQMLLRHMSKQYINMANTESETYASCYRANFVSALTDIGWPENLRKIAITNGNISGIGNGISNGDELLDWVYNVTKYTFHFLAAQSKLYAEGRSDNIVFTGTFTNEQGATITSPCFAIGGGTVVSEVPGGNIIITVWGGFLIGVCVNHYIFRYTNPYKYDCGGSSCINLDGAPGGEHDGISTLNDGIIDAAKTLSGAPMPTLGNGNGLSTFIPTISALALINPVNFNGNYFYDIKSNLNADYTDPNHSHFEAFKGPENSFPNEGHINMKDDNWYVNSGIMTLPGYKGNTNWLMQQIQINEYDLTSTIPSSSGSTYNFDRSQRRLRTVTVNSGGTIQVNGNYPTHWVTSSYPAPEPGLTFTILMPICTTSIVTINNGGSLILGDNNTPDNNKGILDIQSGSSLNLNGGSTFTINDNSKLIIQRGATLNITGTPTINLVGNNSVIEIQDGGTLNVNSSSTFTVVGSGFVRFIGGNGTNYSVTGTGSIIIPGAGSNIGGIQTHKILEFASSSAGNQLGFLNLQNFQVSGGLISSNCDVGFSVPFSLNSVTYNGGSNYCFSPLSVFNSNISSSFNCWNSYNSSIDIEWCNFTGASLTAAHFNNPSVTINFSVFNNCDLGSGALNFTDCSFDLQYDHFLNNTLGIKAEYMSYDSRIYESKFNSPLGNDLYTTGINYSGSSTASLHLDCTDILDMQSSGVQMSGSDLYARCGKILSIVSSNAITLNTDATLKLDPAIESDLGNMDLSGYDVGIFAGDAKNIYINNAFSNLNCVYGTLHGNITTTLSHLDAYHNFWYNGHAPNMYQNYYSFSDPSGQFLNTPPHTVYDPYYLTTAPNIDNACPDRNFAFSIAAPIGTNIAHPNVYSKTGNTHSTKIFDDADSIPYQTGKTLKHAVQSVFVDDIDTTQTGMDFQLNLHEQLLKHNFGIYKNQAKAVVDLVYKRMQQTIAMGIKHNLIQQTAISTQINKLINVQDTLLNRTLISDTINRYILIKDKAFAMRLSNRRNTALTLLSQAHALADSSSKKYIEKWQCFIEKEIQLQDSVITIKQFLALVKNCGGTDTITVYGKQVANTTPTIKENVVAKDINKPVVSLYPNPSFDNLNIAINNLEIETQINIQIIDIVGRIIQAGTYQASDKNAVLSIPLNLKSGTYFIKLDGGNIHEIKRFVVMK